MPVTHKENFHYLIIVVYNETVKLKMFKYLHFGGINGLPFVAHHPTGCTTSEHKFTQKSLPSSNS